MERAEVAAERAGERLHNVQLLRFAAAGFVLFSHAIGLLLPAEAALRRVPWTMGVDIFFVISGFIMVYLTRGCFGTRRAPGAFLLRRLVRVAPPYWLFTTLTIVTALVFDGLVRNASLAPAAIAASYAFLPWPRADGLINPVLSLGWTLNYEMFFYSCFGLALFFRRGLAGLAAVLAVLALAGPLVPESWFMLRFWAAPILLEFVFGIGIGLLYLRGLRLPRWGTLLLLAGGAALTLLRVDPAASHYSRLLVPGLAALAIAAALLLAPDPARPGRLGRALRLGGDSSYALYLSHPFTVHGGILVAAAAGLSLPWLVVPLVLAASVAVAILFYRFVERPMTEALQRLTGARSLSGAASVAP